MEYENKKKMWRGKKNDEKKRTKKYDRTKSIQRASKKC